MGTSEGGEPCEGAVINQRAERTENATVPLTRDQESPPNVSEAVLCTYTRHKLHFFMQSWMNYPQLGESGSAKMSAGFRTECEMDNQCRDFPRVKEDSCYRLVHRIND